MLKSIKIKNFYSIGEEQDVSFEITPKDKLDDSARFIGATPLNVVSCLIGANASGKTTVLEAISFLFRFINESYTTLKNNEPIPVCQHKLRENEPIKIEIEFYNKDVLYRYLIEFNQKIVLKEKLDKKNGRMINVFESHRQGSNIDIKTSLKINESDKTRFKERYNISLLSCLLATGYLPEIHFFNYFISNVNGFKEVSFSPFIFRLLELSSEIQKDEGLRESLLNFSKDIGLDISDFKFTHHSFRTPSKETEPKPLLECIHNKQNEEFTLSILEQSHGTQSSMYLISKILPMFKTGGLVVLDEIDSGLHPYVVKKIISLFEDKSINYNNAQLFFSTHQHPLINDRTKTQIFITEKEKAETKIYRLDDIEGVRNDENFFHKYLAGTYGGIPKVNWLGGRGD